TGGVPESGLRGDAEDLAADRGVYLAQQRGTPDLVEYLARRAVRAVEGPAGHLAQRARRGLDPFEHVGEGEQEFASRTRVRRKAAGKDERALAVEGSRAERDAVGLRATMAEPGTGGLGAGGALGLVHGEEYQAGRAVRGLPAGVEVGERGVAVGSGVH